MASATPRIRPRAMGTGTYTSQGMIAPGDPFVDAEGSLTAVSFRFLFDTLQSISRLQTEVATLQQRLANAGIP